MKTPEYVKSIFDLYDSELVYKTKLSEKIKEAVKTAYIVHALWNFPTGWTESYIPMTIYKDNCLFIDFISILV